MDRRNRRNEINQRIERRRAEERAEEMKEFLARLRRIDFINLKGRIRAVASNDRRIIRERERLIHHVEQIESFSSDLQEIICRDFFPNAELPNTSYQTISGSLKVSHGKICKDINLITEDISGFFYHNHLVNVEIRDACLMLQDAVKLSRTHAGGISMENFPWE